MLNFFFILSQSKATRRDHEIFSKNKNLAKNGFYEIGVLRPSAAIPARLLGACARRDRLLLLDSLHRNRVRRHRERTLENRRLHTPVRLVHRLDQRPQLELLLLREEQPRVHTETSVRWLWQSVCASRRERPADLHQDQSECGH